MAVDDEQVEKALKRVNKLRQDATDARNETAVVAREATNEIRLARLEAEEERLKAKLNTEKAQMRSAKSAIKDTVAGVREGQRVVNPPPTVPDEEEK